MDKWGICRDLQQGPRCFQNYADLLPPATSGHVLTDMPKLLSDAQWDIFPCVFVFITSLFFSCHHWLMQTHWNTLLTDAVEEFFLFLTCQQLELSVIWMFYALAGSTRLYLATAPCLAAYPQTFFIPNKTLTGTLGSVASFRMVSQNDLLPKKKKPLFCDCAY